MSTSFDVAPLCIRTFAARLAPKFANTVKEKLPLPVFVVAGTLIQDTESDAVQVQYGGAVTLIV